MYALLCFALSQVSQQQSYTEQMMRVMVVEMLFTRALIAAASVMKMNQDGGWAYWFRGMYLLMYCSEWVMKVFFIRCKIRPFECKTCCLGSWCHKDLLT